MLKLIGFIVAWVVGVTILSMVINAARAKPGQSLNDPVSAFLEGFAWGPVGILSALDPALRASGKATPRMIGGVLACVVGYALFTSI